MRSVLRVALVMMIPVLAATAPPAAAQIRPPESAAEMQLSFSPVVKRSAPAVVNIYASWVSERRASPFANDPFFSQFFEGFGQSVPRVQNSLGSGVIVASEGIVVSNYHVVQEATDIRVVLADRREFDGEVLLSDRDADIAVIRLQGAEDLPALDFADSDAVEVGDLVLAIGNPFGVGQTVSSGIVSATARASSALRNGPGYFIQTDAPINPGNSGGALVDMSGRLLGLNTSILSRSGGSNGIGFAIPSNLVQRYVEQAREGQADFVHPWAGIAVQPVDGDLALALGQDRPEGVLVSEIHPESPFALAGLRPGDVVLTIGGLPVNAEAELEYRLLTQGFGDRLAVGFLRDGAIEEISVEVGPAPDGGQAEPVRIGGESPLAGLLVAEVTPRLIDELDLPLSASGVIVVRADGPAARLGLRPGDVLRRVNDVPIETAATVTEAARTGTRQWDFEIGRGNRTLRLQLRR
ncbi:trypsin-like peptidase domain-containing protein [Tropicimonas sediminicola]|uniref:Do/DeqQ family serine protease n=1 Tax=Tropicimonas sediminicola TaxID=1031541 RepID=A0A239JHR2_9RHOB|nr:trypsin-like peptidase domain-containing protein [Tropicimonas sediminicola]SNT05349.1 Do/DeqQ family serine protease [Tropicimonas sediminicola]